MPMFISIVLTLVFVVGLIVASTNICCMVHVAYLHDVKQDKRNRTVLPPLGGILMCVSLYFLGYSYFLLPLLLDYPFPLLFIIPAVKVCKSLK